MTTLANLTDEELMALFAEAGGTEEELQVPQQPSDDQLIQSFLDAGGTQEELLQAGISTATTEQDQQAELQKFGQRVKQQEAEKLAAQKELADETTIPQAVLASTGRQFQRAGRVVKGLTGLESPEELAAQRKSEAEVFAPLEANKPGSTIAGEILGGIAVGAPVGGPAAALTKNVLGKAAAPKLAALGGAATAGAIEEFLVEGNPLLGAAFGVGGEVALPLAKKAIGTVFNKLTGKDLTGGLVDENGRLTAQANAELEASGVSLADLGREVEGIMVRQIDPEADLAAQARQAQAATFDSSLTGAQASRSGKLENLEREALSQSNAVGEAARSILSENQQTLIAGAEKRILEPMGSTQTRIAINDMADRGNKTQAAELLRKHLVRQKDIGKGVVSDLYKFAARLPGSDNPIQAERLTEALVAGADRASDEMQNKIEKALVKFGVIGGEIKDLGQGNFSANVGGRNINFRSSQGAKPLTINNAEDLRKEINALSPTSASDAALVVSLKNALDRSTADAVEGLPIDSTKRKAFEIARGQAAKLKDEFEAGDTIEQLLTFKDFKGLVPQLADEKVLDKFISPNGSLTALKKLRGSLQTNPDGKQIWNEVRATTAEDLLKKSLKPQKDGSLALNFKAMGKQLEKIGDEKLKVLFNAGEIKEFKRLQSVLKNIDIPVNQIGQNSGDSGVFRALNMLSRLAVGSTTAGAVDVAGTAIRKGKDDILRRKNLIDGLASIEGRKLSKSARQLSKGAQIQRYIQELAGSIGSEQTGTVGAAIGSQLTGNDDANIR